MRKRMWVAVVAIMALWTPGDALANARTRGGGGAAGAARGRAQGPRANQGRRAFVKQAAQTQRATATMPAEMRVTPTVPEPDPAEEQDDIPDMPGVVHVRQGRVRVVADLARVAYTLTVRNEGARTIEWRRSYDIDPSAQVIGAVLRRDGMAPIPARTLTIDDARRIYAEARTPRRPRNRTPRRPRDPLRVERSQRSQLDVIVWPIQPRETIRVELTFVTPLRGHGDTRTYVDVIEGAEGAGGRTPLAPHERPPESDVGVAEDRITAQTEWLVAPGALQIAAIPVGLRTEGAQDDMLRFVPGANAPRRPRIDFRRTREAPYARVVSGGGLERHIAVWRFDPSALLARHGFVDRAGLTLRIEALDRKLTRIAPNKFLGTDDPRPVTGVYRDVPSHVAYRVSIMDREGHVVEAFDHAIPARRLKHDREVAGAISGWHRAMLVERVFDWARTHGSHNDAIAFAVDLGVLRPGTAALAVPPRERARLSPRSLRLYLNDGVPLGAQRRESDLRLPPKGALE